MKAHLAFLLFALVGAQTPALAQDRTPRILQLYSYKPVDLARFRTRYRTHLLWHARHQDALVWYAWTVQAGPRRGMIIDGTAGASLAALDARPDLAGDGADFAATVGDAAVPVDIETWGLWEASSTARPLEDRKPGKTVDAFLLTVRPSQRSAFEQALAGVARKDGRSGTGLTWYRRFRGGGAADYMVLVSREHWSDIDVQGGPISDILARAYKAAPSALAGVLDKVDAVSTETWSYEPRLSLFPGQPLVD